MGYIFCLALIFALNHLIVGSGKRSPRIPKVVESGRKSHHGLPIL